MKNVASITNAAITALRRLAKKKVTQEHYESFIREIAAVGNDRGMAILMATGVEDALESAISLRLCVNEASYDLLFGRSSPMGTFESKICIAYTLEMFREETKTNLDLIRAIRNSFAHAKVPISFQTNQIKEACALLIVPTMFQPRATFEWQDHQQLLEARPRFDAVCKTLMVNFGYYGVLCDTSTELPDMRYEKMVRPKPLP